MQKKRLVLFVESLAVLGTSVAILLFLLTGTEQPVPVFSHDRLTIERADGKTFTFNIDLATTPEQQSHGLMFRRSMPLDAGMLFLFRTVETANFWMKNTYISLDMLFVRQNGTISKIVARTTPHDLSKIFSDEPVAAVLEINGGEAERLGVKPGDKALYPAFAENRQR
jgi:uncharacterized protein